MNQVVRACWLNKGEIRIVLAWIRRSVDVMLRAEHETSGKCIPAP